MKPRTYATPAAFKAALDQRLRKVAETGADVTRRRQLLVFDRYLARLTHVLGDAATLKGGLVLEVRLERARTTRDIDLRLAGSPDGLLGRLQEAGRVDLADFMPSRYGSTRDIRTSLVLVSSTKDSASGPSAGWRECSVARLSGSTGDRCHERLHVNGHHRLLVGDSPRPSAMNLSRSARRKRSDLPT